MNDLCPRQNKRKWWKVGPVGGGGNGVQRAFVMRGPEMRDGAHKPLAYRRRDPDAE